MGYTERDYYREDNPAEAAGISAQSMVMRVIVINVVVFLATWLTKTPQVLNPKTHMIEGGYWLTDLLAVHGDTLLHPLELWQLLTAGFVHSNEGLWHIFGNMFGLYVFGRPFEERSGPREFLRFYLIAIVLGNLVWCTRQLFLVKPIVDELGIEHWGAALGASGGVTAVMVLFCLLNPRATLLVFFAIPAPAWVVGLFIVGSDLTGALTPGRNVNHIAFDVHLAGAAFAVAYWYFGWNFGRLPGMAGLARLASRAGGMLSRSPDLKVHDPLEWDEDLEAQADRLLEKVGRLGQASLTAKERRLLEDYSRRLRQKNR